MEVLFGKTSDIEQWMNLIKRVSWNFPGLETDESIEEHSQTVLKFMDKKQALCIKHGNDIAGVILFSRNRSMICCMAVAPEYRRQGIGSALLEKALGELDRSKEISVSTFREDDEKGIAPRALYKKFGFKEAELIEEFGYPNQRLVLYP
ncbi:MAG: GNAT family N-acetyltransferase [Oscillospiraceae bacterium]|nr:GNAT family N-acetyltransferase [Oscillospiraceae bacterium]MDE7278973.1 GNAT family N-acetyltransferase [Oscillospiraceae bacterium]